MQFSFVKLALRGDELPTEFLLFRRGVNSTLKGDFLFDDRSAELVMSAAVEHGVDIMIDLEHLSLDPESQSYDPDARAWAKLELRSGDLWVNEVRWTSDGARRLTSKTQRYVSPAFEVDESIDPPRITRIHNIALTAVPATHRTPALVAANTRGTKMDPKQLAAILKLRAEGKSDDDVLRTLAIDIKSLQAVVKAMGGDPNAPLGQLMGAVAAYAKELADMAKGDTGESKESPVSETPDAPEEEQQMTSTSASDTSELIALRAQRDAAAKAQAQELAMLKKQIADREERDRVELVASLVRAGAMTPAIAWANPDTREVSDMIRKLSIDDLVGWSKRIGAPSVGYVPPSSSPVVAVDSDRADISEYEAKRVQVLADRNKVDSEIAIERYRDIKQRQLLGAMRTGREERFGRRLNQSDVIASVTGRIGPAEVRTLTNAVRPHEAFGATAQRAIEEFRLDLMVNLSAMPDDWTQRFGMTVPGGTTKDTFPLDFSAVKFQERLGQNAAAETPQSRDIQLTKREFRAAKMGDLRRIQDGDFAYIRTWQQGAAQMARAKISLRAKLVKTILEAGVSTYWGASATQATGVEGVYYFATTHKVHPFDPSMTIASSGSATWSNYQASATPLGTANLFQELDSMLYVPHFDGELLGTEGDAILLPTSLVGVARRMFDQQAFRSDGETSSVQLTNEFYGRPMERIHATNLTGTDGTASYYLIAQGTIAMGFYPWVVAEDAQDEVLIWDESSDYYKQTGQIKVEDKTYINAALAWPHAIRLVKGA